MKKIISLFITLSFLLASSVGAASPIVIDAGHGGEDGGAVSQSGVLEKDLNLLLADDIAHLCVLFGQPYEMTREDDTMLYSLYGDNYEGRKKALDLKNRLKFTEEHGAAILLSIHMNKFTDPRYGGLQVYYSPNTEDSRQIALEVQSAVKRELQTENSREAKAAGSSIYILKNTETPAVLVECGFLSNPADTENLTDPSYRAALACVIAAPVFEYTVRK